MKFRFFGHPPETSKEEALRGLCKLGQSAIYKITERLKVYEKFSFSHLQKLGEIQKIKGRNPDKVHELRMRFPEGRFRIFFVIIIEEDALVLHVASKKKQKIQDDIRIAMRRAAEINTPRS